MERADYIKLYSYPECYEPPNEASDFGTCYPNLNSKEYRHKLLDKTSKLNNFYESLSVNSRGLAVLASNDIRGRVWSGSIWGFENLKDIGETNSCFKIQADSPISRIMFIEDRIFLVGQTNGSVNLWSTQSEARDACGFCLFMIGEKKEHVGSVLDMDLLCNKTKFVTGSNDRSIKVWDTGAADLSCICSMSFTHSDDVTSVSSSPSKEEMFASCSSDKSALFWDYRVARPAKALYENHIVGFSTINWCNTEEQNEQIFLGDESGYIHKIDPKMPGKFMLSMKVFNRPIKKISYNSGVTAIIGLINAVHIYNNDNSLVYRNEAASNLIRDLFWEETNSLYTIGWSREFRHHSFSLN